MKSLQESLFDKDLVNKDISFFNRYEWDWSVNYLSYHYGNKEYKYREVDEISIDKASKYLKSNIINTQVANKLPHPEILIAKGEDDVLSRQVYDVLSKSSIGQITYKEDLANIIVDALKKIINDDNLGEISAKCCTHPTGKSKLPLYNRTVESVDCSVKIRLDIDDCDFKLDYRLGLKRKKRK